MSGEASPRWAHELSRLDRRAFLRFAALGTAAAWLPGCRAAPADREPPAGLLLRHLSPRGYAVLDAAAERFVGPRGGALVAARRVDPGAAVERFLGESPDWAGPLGQALLALEFGVWPLLPKWRPFTALDGAARDAVLADLRESGLAPKRQAYAGIRSVCLLGFYGAVSEARPPGFTLGEIPPEASIAAAMRPLEPDPAPTRS